MPFEKFRLLPEDTKIQKLIIAYEKIAHRAARDKWIFKCCRNYDLVEEIYDAFLDMMCNIRSFVYFLLEDDDIESKPGCSGRNASVSGLDFFGHRFRSASWCILQRLSKLWNSWWWKAGRYVWIVS